MDAGSLAARLVLGPAAGAALAYWGYRVRLLSVSGAIASLVAVGLIVLAGGWAWGVSVVVLLVTTGLWSRYRNADKAQPLERPADRATYGWAQVAARAGWPALLAVLNLRGSDKASIFAAFIGALAVACADAWATEVGVLSPQSPRLMIAGRRVPAGAPGGISMLGVVAAAAGAWLIGFSGLVASAIATWLSRNVLEAQVRWFPLAALLGGMAGCLTDSLLASTAQGVYYCEHCGRHTEKAVHLCGRLSSQMRGWAWLTSEGIDYVSSLVGAAVTACASLWLAQTMARW